MAEEHVHKQTLSILHRISRSEGHLRAIKRMVEEGKPCPEILIQLAAVKGAVDQIARIVLEDHIESCLRNAVAGANADEAWWDLKEALEKYIS